MSTFRSNKVYICNIDDDVEKYAKQFDLTMMSPHSTMHLGERYIGTRYDERVYNRGELLQQKQFNREANTAADKFAQSIHTSSELRNTVIRNDSCHFNTYKPDQKSDMYTLSTPIQPYNGDHTLLFEKPNYSNSCTPPINTVAPFLNFTREQRNM